MTTGKYKKSSWIDGFRESDKYVGSFEIQVKTNNGRVLQAWVRPADHNQFFSVVLNNVFLGHLRKDPDWQDMTGKKTEVITQVGKLIDEHLNSRK